MGTKSQEAMAAAWDDGAGDELDADLPPEEALEEVHAAPGDELPDVPEPDAGADQDDEPEPAAKEPQKPAKRAPQPRLKGKFASPGQVPAPVKPTARALPGAPAAAPGAVAPPVAPELMKAPTGWGPAAKEHWAKLPAEVQREAARRDKEAAVAVTRASQAEQQLRPWADAVAPFQTLVQASGVSAPALVRNALGVVHTLSYGGQPHKARAVANLIRSYGVDVQAVADELDGKGGAGAGAGGQPQGFDPGQYAQQLEQRIFGQLEQRQRQATYQREIAALESWGKNKEFLDELRPDMADLVDTARRRGVTLDHDGAYTRALQLHKADPDSEIGKILRQREAAEQAKAKSAKAQQRRAASIGVRGSPVLGNPNGDQPRSRREVLEAAYDASESE